MMDFDYVCRRSQPSVAAMVYPMVGGDSKQNFYWGHKEVLVPIYKNMADAMRNHPDADVLVSFIFCSGSLMKFFYFWYFIQNWLFTVTLTPLVNFSVVLSK
jgi:hypothetical protein